jgi:Holliday junction resolvasome RuvABC endonuclease subunit
MLPKLVAYDTAKKIDDELDAIAVALTHLAHVRLNYPQYRN